MIFWLIGTHILNLNEKSDYGRHFVFMHRENIYLCTTDVDCLQKLKQNCSSRYSLYFFVCLSLLMYVFDNYVCVILRVCVNFNVWYIRSYASLGNDNIFVWREQATDYRLLFLKNFVCFISPLAVLPFCISCIAAHLVKWFCSSVMFTHRKPFDALCSA